MIPNSDTFMSMLKNQDQVINTILKDLSTCDKNMTSFRKLESLLDQGKEVSPGAAMKASAKSLRHMNDMNRRLLMILLVYVSGGSYSSDTGKVLMKMGRGKEALQEMFKRKVNGN